MPMGAEKSRQNGSKEYFTEDMARLEKRNGQTSPWMKMEFLLKWLFSSIDSAAPSSPPRPLGKYFDKQFTDVTEKDLESC